ncbi:uncharacterized protein LOC122311308 isoform X5 [Carya illinoinensis]|uniref:uncharacterized protein LOC122311308 isoform X5 n=1 Tax=Carya illinoinensis TaxID=32201 RepID=UPI001C725DF1|nr:uncharacterized protein LOC122311308 isoform X5 [Carya illinoinensis]
MEIISRAPFAEVIVFHESKAYGGTKVYDVEVDQWRNRFTVRGEEPYKTLPGDVFVLADAKPEDVSDLQRIGRQWAFVAVTKIPEDVNEDDSTSTRFKVKALKDIELDPGNHKSLFVIFLTNTTPNKRIWNALHMRGNLQIIKKVLCTNSLIEEDCDLCSAESDGSWHEKFGTSINSKLNEPQTQTFLACLRKMHCSHKTEVELIRGLPGTGKTKIISTLLLSFFRMGYRTLTCAPTNVAITGVASCITELVKESLENDDSFCSLGDILLFGNKERLKLGSDIEEIYLDYRVQRLTECLGHLTGWRHCFDSMIDLLEDCVSQYHMLLENESIREREKSKEKEIKEENGEETDASNEMCKSFLDFVRKRFDSISSPLKNCLLIFCTHLPKSYTQSNFQNMISLIGLLESFENLLFQDGVESEVLEELFSRLEVVGDTAQPLMDIPFQLQARRRECLFVLKTLKGSFNELELPMGMNKESIMDFCLRAASLLLCTASSSYKLHSVVMKPLSILVIDEAAQLKECESAIPLQLPGLRHAILVGDECQLPAMVESKISSEAGFGRSLFERMSSLGHSKHLLDIQYRMHPSISFFPNMNFYCNRILDAPDVKRKGYEKHYLPGPMFGTYSFINIVDGREERDVGYGWRNLVEVAVVMKILLNLYKAWVRSRQKLSIGVISPYAAQVAAIQDKLGRKYVNIDGFTVKVKSVDGFQGGEEDIIIISTVRCNRYGSIGFLSNPQRTNVALTRARHCLWILGNEGTLGNSVSIWKALVLDAKERRCFFNADEDNDLHKALLDVKREFEQFEDLLNGDSLLFRSARWKVLFSDNFLKSFKKLKSVMRKNSVIELLLKLSRGWRPKKRSSDPVCGSSSQIIKQFKVEDLYIVCANDIRKEWSDVVKELMYDQVLKVWDILPAEEIPKLIKRLDSMFGKYTDDFLNRCKEKCLEGDLEVPKSWSSSFDIIRIVNVANGENESDLVGCTSDGRSYVENAKVSESLMLMKFYSFSSGVVGQLLSNKDSGELDLPFEVTDQEQEIIIFPRSAFILGRSGTGKTTVLTRKLLEKEKVHQMATELFYGVKSDNLVHSPENEVEETLAETKRTILHQLFVTVSHKLCYAVKLQVTQHVSQLKSSVCDGDCSKGTSSNDIDDFDDAVQFKDIPNSFVGVPTMSYPLVITFHKFLMMLDGTVDNSYFERFHEVRQLDPGRVGGRSVALETFIKLKEVNYERFSLSYWPHFNAKLITKLDSSRVFTEIISHIKGGPQAVEEGDEQVILVRDDFAQKEVSKYVGKQALVLTIVECKGLEFQDVLLYNFFGSSPLKNKWRVISEYMKEYDLFDSTSRSTFSTKHNDLCSELKQLYVAITRTRQRLWICENTEEFCKPMFDYWKKKCLVQVRQLDDSLVQAMQVASSSEEWRSKGMKLYHDCNYEIATVCFERARDTYWERRSKAAGLRATADQMRHSNPEAANVILREAADIFEAIGKGDFAARCFFELGEYERAGRLYLEKCGESKLEKAGECFSLAGCYELAADVYARGYFFPECLKVCSKGKLFDKGLEYICYWKQEATMDFGVVRIGKEIEKLELEFLEGCAHHYYERKDHKSMMRFVKGFHSIELMREFLNRLDCFDELLLLEEELGNFLEAANIAKLRGEILKASDLLGKAGNFKEASMLILLFVLSSSLWTVGSKGWPLKQFTEKQELLAKAKSFAKNESNNFYACVCTEADVLSNEKTSMSVMKKSLNSSQRHKSACGEIISARKIIDAHLQTNSSKYMWEDYFVFDRIKHSNKMISRNQIFVETLVYFWNFWKDHVVNIFKYLRSLETQDFNEYKQYGDFCLNYMGVWRQFRELNAIYLLLNPGADWVRDLDNQFLHQNGKLVSINVRHLASTVGSYWSLEILSVGLQVLKHLEALYNLSLQNNLSMFCQSRSLTHIYEVAKSLLDCGYRDDKTLKRFVKFSAESFFGYVFPLDWQKSVAENMFSLRGSEVSRNLLQQAILENISSRGKLTYGKIGRVVMIIFGLGKLNNDLYEKILKLFDGIDGNSPWKTFIQSLCGNVDISFPHATVPDNIFKSLRECSLLFKLFEVLKDTHNANWMKENDYISPGCFLYLVERLLILASSFHGYFITSKSSFVEWFIYKEVDNNPNSTFVSEVQPSLGGIYESIIDFVQQLLFNKKETLEWIRRSNIIYVQDYYSLLVLRLVAIICLVYLNTGRFLDSLFELLGKSYITEQLPSEFYDVLRRRQKHLHMNVNVLAEAFKKVNNSLVIVSLGKNFWQFLCPDAIFVDMTAKQSWDEMLRVLRLQTIEASRGQIGAIEVGATNACGEVSSSNSYDHGGYKLAPSNLAGQGDLNNIIGIELPINYSYFWDRFFEALKPLEVGGDPRCMLENDQAIKVNMGECIHLLSIIMSECHQMNIYHKHGKLLNEVAGMLEELNLLSIALDARELQPGNNMSMIGELSKRLQSRRQHVEPFLRWTLETDNTSVDWYNEMDSDGEAKEGSNVDKGKSNALKVVAVYGAYNQSRKETQNKGNKKSKKKNRGKGSRKK